MSNNLIENIKREEGFKKDIYIDPLQIDKVPKEILSWLKENQDMLNLTIGYGTLMEDITPEFAEVMLNYKLSKKQSEVNSSFYELDAPSELWDILYEMCYQLGLPRLLKFKKMIAAIHDKNYELASYEMKNSKWYIQTPNRVERLSERMRNIK